MPQFSRGDKVKCISSRTHLTYGATYTVSEAHFESVLLMDDRHNHTWFYASRFVFADDNLFSEVMP